MSLKITGAGAYDTRIIDQETGADITASLQAAQLRLVIPKGGAARLEYDVPVTLDYAVQGAAKAFIACPETGRSREVAEIGFADGGRLTFPRDFSAFGDVQQAEEALTKSAART